ncbi:hypothetical protein K9U40_15180 [Xanthobacter autotrophicus]|uniref:hypothetical protein n=1 Tax=Xanthobacter TaxID=279 RepID=UPI0024ABEEC3|nr:hypothetical protein [Xanthobacter autotrophicus]MDI4665655.1 hypothetical protein [Xanthobacter autotrophicus]
MKKTQIVEELGEGGLLLPRLIEDALHANDSAKLRMTALQEAAAHARDPVRPARTLAAEARAAGVGADDLDAVIAGARALEGGGCLVPGAGRLAAGILDDIDLMTAPLEAARSAGAPAFRARLAALRGDLPRMDGDVVDDGALAAVTSARRGGADSAHLLVMDLHKALNQLTAQIAVETVAGARALGIDAQDRPRIEAFMRGLDGTRGLVFGHPGLDTTASRNGGRLVLQNDIGTTDAHVIIVTVEGLAATVTYTDVHRVRARFFIALFRDFSAEWTPLSERSAPGLAEDEPFYLVTGRYAGRDEADLDAFLAAVGANLPFLIDWNKARKALKTFVDKATAIRLLDRAAREQHGHRAFLELGGAELVFEAVRHNAEGRVPYGARLDRVLGEAAVERFLGEVLRLTAEGLRANRSVRLIRDEVRAELARGFGSAEQEILDHALRQLGLARMLAARLAEALDAGAGLAEAEREAFRAAAKQLEEKADRQVLAARERASGPYARGRSFLPLIDSVEDAIDCFEEAAFLLAVARLPDQSGGTGVPLRALAEHAVDCSSDLVRAVAASCDVPAGLREDITGTLEAIEAVIEGERRADQAQRSVLAAALSAPEQPQALFATVELARAIETGTDHLARAALALRAGVLEETAK